MSLEYYFAIVVATCVSAWGCGCTSSDLARAFGSSYNIGELLLHYEGKHGAIPPSQLVDSESGVITSWRTAVLVEANFDRKFDGYRTEEPWTSAHNRAYESRGREYFCLSREVHSTIFVAVTGTDTAFDPNVRTKLFDLPHNLVIFLSTRDSQIHWMEPLVVLVISPRRAGGDFNHHVGRLPFLPDFISATKTRLAIEYHEAVGRDVSDIVPFKGIDEQITRHIDPLTVIPPAKPIGNANHPPLVEIGFAHRQPIGFRIRDFRIGFNRRHGNNGG